MHLMPEDGQYGLTM